MFGFKSKGEKHKEAIVESIGKKAGNWYEFNQLLLANENGREMLKLPRASVGTVLFYIGSIDFLCQQENIEDNDTADITIDLLECMGFLKEYTTPIYLNFYTNPPDRSKFALDANLAGGKGIRDHMAREVTHPPLPKLVAEWAKLGQLDHEDHWLFFGDVGETPNNDVDEAPYNYDRELMLIGKLLSDQILLSTTEHEDEGEFEWTAEKSAFTAGYVESLSWVIFEPLGLSDKSEIKATVERICTIKNDFASAEELGQQEIVLRKLWETVSSGWEFTSESSKRHNELEYNKAKVAHAQGIYAGVASAIKWNSKDYGIIELGLYLSGRQTSFS